MVFKTYPYARNEVPNDDYRRNPNDATKDRVKGILREHGLLSSTAFANLIFDDIKSKGSNFLDVQAILDSARRQGVPEDEELWTGVFDEGFEDYNTQANRVLILSETKPPIGPTALANLLRDIYSSSPDRLILTPEAYARRQELAERNSMIKELTSAGSFVVIRPDGRKVRYDSDGKPIEFTSNGMTPINGRGRESDPGFQGMATDQIRDLYKTVVEQRRLQSLSREELKAEINPARRQIFEASNASSRPTPEGVELVNPDTGQVISTKRDLIRYVNAGRYNTERLLKTGPNGSTDKAKAREFERILNS